VDIGAYIVVLVTSYFLGSVPAGYLAGKARGIDVRTVGSGNIGATNAFRVLGKTAGTVVLLSDAFKGFVAARWVPLLAVYLFPGAAPHQEYLALAAGAAAILGHNFTCWLKFKGGKGIATSAGLVLAWAPLACLMALAVWGVVFVLTRFVSLGSIVAAVVLPFAVWYCPPSGRLTMTIVMAGLSLLAIYKHKGNIQRLLNGTESRLGKKAERPVSQ
jgi:acyl phosphate:glycerol-3-phosphate acyltransferase